MAHRDTLIKLKDFKADEKVLVVARHHWFVFFRELIGLLVLFFLPFFVVPILGIFVSAGAGIAIPSGVGFFLASLWALILWQMLFARWTDYYYDIWIVTNWRIIDIEQKSFFSRDVATLLNLDKIEDIATRVNSVLGTFLEYGTIQIQTAASHREFIFDEAADPRGVEKIIRKAQEERMKLNATAHYGGHV